MPSKTIISFEHASVSFAETLAVDNASFSMEAGEHVAVVGPSGSGKTTLLRMINGTVVPTGHVHVEGDCIRKLSPHQLRKLRTRIGFIHQNLNLVPNLRVVQNVMAGRLGSVSLLSSLRRMLIPNRQELREIHAILDQVGIEEKLFERTDKLSGGQQQRVAVARALYQQPHVILADEPVSSVDPARAEDLIRLLTDVSSQRGITLCVSLHNLELARRYFPRLIGIRQGAIVFDDATENLSDKEFGNLYHLTNGELLADHVEI